MVERRVVDQEVTRGLRIDARAQYELFLRQVDLQCSADSLRNAGAPSRPLLCRVMPEPNAGLQITGALACGGKVVTSKIESELAGTTSDHVAVYPASRDAVGTAAYP